MSTTGVAATTSSTCRITRRFSHAYAPVACDSVANTVRSKSRVPLSDQTAHDRPSGRPSGCSGWSASSRAARVLVVRVAAELACRVRAYLRELFAIELHAEPGPVGHSDRAVLVLHLPAVDDVVGRAGGSARRRRTTRFGMTAPRCSIVASWIPSSPDECTATPSWNVSQTPAALTHWRMPPQKVVSSRMTSTARVEDVGGELLEADDDGVRRGRDAHHLAHAAHARSCRRRGPRSSRCSGPRSPARSGSPARRTRRRSDRSGRRSPGQRRGERAVVLELDLRREDAALELVGGEAVASPSAPSRARPSGRSVRTSPLPSAARVAEEQVRRERHAVPQLPPRMS